MSSGCECRNVRVPCPGLRPGEAEPEPPHRSQDRRTVEPPDPARHCASARVLATRWSRRHCEVMS
jgi:hypothetical protein